MRIFLGGYLLFCSICLFEKSIFPSHHIAHISRSVPSLFLLSVCSCEHSAFVSCPRLFCTNTLALVLSHSLIPPFPLCQNALLKNQSPSLISVYFVSQLEALSILPNGHTMPRASTLTVITNKEGGKRTVKKRATLGSTKKKKKSTFSNNEANSLSQDQ